MDHTKNTKMPCEVRSKKRSCLGCLYYKRIESLDYCNWFHEHRHQKMKQIPENILRKGCDKREPSVESVEDSTGIIQLIINKFDGELI